MPDCCSQPFAPGRSVFEALQSPPALKLPAFDQSILSHLMPPSDVLLATERSRVRLLCRSLEKQLSPKREAKQVKCQPRF